MMEANEVKADLAGTVISSWSGTMGVGVYDFITYVIFPRHTWRRVEIREAYDQDTEPVIEIVYNPMGNTGPTPMVIGWQMVEREAVVWDDNELVNVNFFDFWPDPRVRRRFLPFVFQREWCTQEQLEEKLQVLEAAGSGEVYPIDWEALRGAQGELQDGAWELMSSVGLTPEASDGYWSKEGAKDTCLKCSTIGRMSVTQSWSTASS